tara:strand:+ start:835 stop:1446 length:612 start_codon:yes stop_codon:yes gene_type:complete
VNKRLFKWDNMYKDGSGNMFPEPIVVRFVKSCIEKKNKLILSALDIGCGLGSHSLMMSQLGINVTALDFSINAIEKLNKVIKNRNIHNLKTVNSGIENYEIEKNKYDLILDIASLQHANISQMNDIFSNIKKALQLNGHFYSWSLSDSKNVNDNDFEHSIISKKFLENCFIDDFSLSFDNYKYTQNNEKDYISFLIFSAKRIK